MNSKQMEKMAQQQDMSGMDPEFAEETAQAAANAATTGYKKIEEGVVAGYKKIENGVVSGYKKIEDGVVEGFGKVTDACVKTLFAREGESVEDAKARLSGKKNV